MIISQVNWISSIVHFKLNNCSGREIHQALYPLLKEDKPEEDLTSIAFLARVSPTFSHMQHTATS